MKIFRIASIPGDGIGIEVIAEGIKVLDELARRDGGFGLQFTHFDWSSERYLKTGAYILGEPRGAARLMKAVEATTARGEFTPDLGGDARTAEVTDAVIAAL